MNEQVKEIKQLANDFVKMNISQLSDVQLKLVYFSAREQALVAEEEMMKRGLEEDGNE